jgi:hypothetical protein
VLAAARRELSTADRQLWRILPGMTNAKDQLRNFSIFAGLRSLLTRLR